MAFKAYEPIPPMVFPIKGKDYTVVAIAERGWQEGARWQEIFGGTDPGPSNADQPKLVLGAVFEEMQADGVGLRAIALASLAVLTDYRFEDRAAAEKVWESGIDPEALAAAMAATRTSPTPTPSTSTAAVAKTRAPASTSGTRTSRTTSKGKAKARASRS